MCCPRKEGTLERLLPQLPTAISSLSITLQHPGGPAALPPQLGAPAAPAAPQPVAAGTATANLPSPSDQVLQLQRLSAGNLLSAEQPPDGSTAGSSGGEQPTAGGPDGWAGPAFTELRRLSLKGVDMCGGRAVKWLGGMPALEVGCR